MLCAGGATDGSPWRKSPDPDRTKTRAPAGRRSVDGNDVLMAGSRVGIGALWAISGSQIPSVKTYSKGTIYASFPGAIFAFISAVRANESWCGPSPFTLVSQAPT